MERTGLSETDFLDGESCTKEELLKGKAITHFHSCIRRILREEGEEAADAFAEELFRENPGMLKAHRFHPERKGMIMEIPGRRNRLVDFP